MKWRGPRWTEHWARIGEITSTQGKVVENLVGISRNGGKDITLVDLGNASRLSGLAKGKVLWLLLILAALDTSAPRC